MTTATTLDRDRDARGVGAAAPSAPDASGVHATPAAPAQAAKPSRTKLVLGAMALVGAVVGGGYYVLHRGLETTDDAQLDADLVAVPSRMSGTVAKLDFTDNQHVKAGDVLVELDADQANARLAEAEANLAAAEANARAADADARVAERSAHANKDAAEASLHGAASSATASRDQITEAQAGVASAQANYDKAALDLARTKQLVSNGALPQAQLDLAQTSFDGASAQLSQMKAHLGSMQASTSQAQSRVQEASARAEQMSDVEAYIEQAHAKAVAKHAEVATAKAMRDLAALDVGYTKIVAPADGVVSKRTVSVGQMVQPGQPVAEVVPDGQLWVTGNFKETQITKMKVGQRAKIEIDAFPGVDLEGELESFSAATGAKFTLLPPDNASGNFTKVVQRLPVRVKLDKLPEGVALRPGLSVDLTIDTRK